MIALVNLTRFPAHAAAGGLPPERFSILDPEPWRSVVQVVVKATFAVSDGRAAPSPEQLPILARDAETADGFMEGDLCLEKGGVDLVVLGSACPPHMRPVREMQVALHLGALSRVYAVTGDRSWTRRRLAWQPTDPLPFTTMPLGFEQAFGGTYKLPNGDEVPFTRNPIGKGWTPQLEGVPFDGRPLPNLELARQRVTGPDEEPDPAGFAWYRLAWALRMIQGVALRGDDPPAPLPRLWNGAHPDLVLNEYPEGQALRLDGFRPDGALGFEVPLLPIALEHDLGGSFARVPARPDTLCVLPGQGRMFVLARWLVPYDPAADRSGEVRLVSATSECDRQEATP